uniref:kelch-like protein 1 n=1 Tax=Styela clava TaxID=7725 RepID=UPI00193A0D31|nr:kelch-like protein 1 [Styela clava]
MVEARNGFIIMKDICADAVGQCVDFMYTGEANSSMESVENTLYASHLMQLDVLSSICFNFMENNLSVQHCFLVVRLASLYDRTELKPIAERFIVDNFESLISGEDFLHLCKKELIFYLQKMDKKHEVVWHAVRRWISNKGEKIGLELMETCHFGKFPYKFLLTDLLNNSLVESSLDAKSFVVKILLSNINGLKENLSLETLFVLRKINWIENKVCSENVRNIINEFMARNFEQIVPMDEFLENEPLVKESHKCKDLLLDVLCARADVIKHVQHIAVPTKTGIKALNLQTNQWSSLQSDYYVSFHLVNVEGQLYASDGNELSLLQDGRWIKKAKIKRKTHGNDKMFYLKSGIYIINSAQHTARYDIAKDRWDKNLPPCRIGGCFCAAASDEFIYAMGGWSAEKEAKVYDPGTNKWSFLPQIHGTGGGAAVVFQRMVYVLGGYDEGRVDNLVQCYNPVVRSWTEIAKMKMNRSLFGTCVVDNKMYAVGGAEGERLTKDSIETFNEETGKWERVCEMNRLYIPWVYCCSYAL